MRGMGEAECVLFAIGSGSPKARKKVSSLPGNAHLLNSYLQAACLYLRASEEHLAHQKSWQKLNHPPPPLFIQGIWDRDPWRNLKQTHGVPPL